LIAVAALSGCTSTDVLEPSAIVTDGQANASSEAAAAQPGSALPSGSAPQPTPPGAAVAAVPGQTRLQFAPIVGTPVEAAGPLGERLALRARERGIPIARAGEPQSHILKGYFSALGEGKQTLVVYVWDILDASGNRLHRIQGQQAVPGGKGWDSVPASTMQGIADTTMQQLADWLGNKSG
jgi:hypothetical protein